MFKHFATFSLIGKNAFIFCHAVLSLKHPVSFNRNTWQLIFFSFTSISTANCIFTILQSRGKEKQIRKIFYLSTELCTIMKHLLIKYRELHGINNKCCKGCGEKGTLLHCEWDCKLVQTIQKTYGGSSKS